MNQRVFQVEVGFGDGNVEYRSGSGIPTALSGGALAIINAMPKGSFYTDILTGATFKKKGSAGTAADWRRELDENDYSTLLALTEAGGSANAALQAEVDTLEAAVGLAADGTLGAALAGTNYVSGATSLAGGLRTLDQQAKSNADAVAAEVTRATAAEQTITDALNTEITNRVDAVAAAAATAASQLATETAARIAGDDAANTRMDGLQTELDTTQAGAGLNTDGTYTAPVGTSYLDASTSLKDADAKLDTALAAEVARATGVEASLASALANEAQLRTDADTALQTQITEWVNVQLTNNANADLVEQAARIAGDTALQNELDATQAAIGLDTNGNIIPITGTNYLDGVTTVFGGAFVLDTQIKTVSDALAAEVTNRTNTDTALQNSIDTELARATAAENAIQLELNTTQAGAGLETSGAYAAPVGSNYLGAATSLKDADSVLDAALKVVSDAVAAETARATAAETAENTRAVAAEAALQTAITNEETRAVAAEAALQAAVTLLDQKQTETATLLLSARKESNATAVSAATMIDEVATQQVEAAKWIVYAKGVGADSQKRVVMEVMAMHNGTATVDADAVDYTTFAKLKLGVLPADLVFSVELSGVGSAQRMQLKVASPTTSVDVYAVRERIPGIDLGAGSPGGGDGDNWTPGDTDFLFGNESYTPNPNIVF